MKRLGISFIILFLVVATIAMTLGVYFFMVAKKPPAVETREILKKFSFSSPQSLEEWDEKILAKDSTGYTVTELDGAKCVKAESVDSASALFFKQRLTCKKDPFLSWDWKSDKFPGRKKKENLKDKKEFDFVAQVYVVFYARFFLNAKAIQYIWTESVPEGTATDSPYTKKVKLLVLESGPSEEWKHEERDIKKDYLELFGEELDKDVDAIAFMTDADSTATTASAYFKGIEFGYLGKVEEETEPEGEIEEKPKEEVKKEEKKEEDKKEEEKIPSETINGVPEQ